MTDVMPSSSSVREIRLTHGLIAMVDAADFDQVLAAGRWHPKPGRSGDCYAHRNVKRDGKWTTQTLHAFLTGWPLVDHINGNGLDNRRVNLRPADRQANLRNLHRHRSSSGYKGVSWNRKSRKWVARITIDGRTYSLGYHPTPAAAALAYDAAARERFGEFARPNFPQPNQGVESWQD